MFNWLVFSFNFFLSFSCICLFYLFLLFYWSGLVFEFIFWVHYQIMVGRCYAECFGGWKYYAFHQHSPNQTAMHSNRVCWKDWNVWKFVVWGRYEIVYISRLLNRPLSTQCLFQDIFVFQKYIMLITVMSI